LSSLANLCKQPRNDSEHETSRRRDLRDELETEKQRLSNTITKTDNNTKAIQKAMQVLTSEGEHKDNVRIMVIKKRNMNMRAFFANFVGFQNHLVQNAAVVQISSAGPV
jgi:predicted nuclease with TOPRIM domain